MIKLFLLIGLLLVSAVVPILAEDEPVKLLETKLLAPDVAAYPRLAANGDKATAKINKTLELEEGQLRKNIKDCRARVLPNSGSHSEISSDVQVPMLGPDFIVFVRTNKFYCGGAYGETDLHSLVFNLKTGELIDWHKVLPDGFLKQSMDDKAADKSAPGTVSSDALMAAYVAGYDQRKQDCLKTLQFVPETEFVLWPDAKNDGIALFPVVTEHVKQACAVPVALPTDQLRSMGVDARLLDAIQAAHDHGWYDKAAAN